MSNEPNDSGQPEGVPAAEDDFLTVVEFAAIYKGKLAKRTIDEWRYRVNNGPTFRRVGGKILYKMSDIRAWDQDRPSPT